MNVSLTEIIAACGTVCGGAVWLIHAIVRPLRESLDRINMTLEKLDQSINEERERRHSIEVDLQALEVTVENHEHRIETLERK